MNQGTTTRWGKAKLGDYLTTLTDYHANGSYKKLKANVELLDLPNYAVMIRTTNFEKGDFRDDLKYIARSAYNFLHKSKVYPDDILMNKIANAGSVYCMPNLHRPVSLGMNLFLIRTSEEDTWQRFIYYYLKANEAYIKQFAIGTAATTITKEAVRNLEILLPPLPTQRKIASVLSAYDDLIENNTRRIEILEKLAQATYREWFMNFRFPGHEQVRMVDSPLGQIPEEWQVRSITNVPTFRFIRENLRPYEGRKEYFATADIDGINIINSGSWFSYVDKPSRAQKQPVLNSVWFARMKDTYKVLLFSQANREVAERSMLSSGFAGFEASDDWLGFLYFTINSPEFHQLKDMYCTGATQMALTNKGLDSIELKVPDTEVAARYGRLVSPIIDHILILQAKNTNLRHTRDLLLPKLISGEVDVSELNINIAGTKEKLGA